MSTATDLPEAPRRRALELTRRITSLPLYVFTWLDELKAQARARGADLIDLGIGSPDLPTPEPVRRAAVAALERGADHGYPPFRGTAEFREAAAWFMHDRFGVTVRAEDEILCVSGAKEAMAQLTLAFVDEQGASLVPDVYYPVHARATQMAQGEVIALPLRAEHGFLPRLDEIPAEALRRARLLIVNYPHNPTGAVAPLEFFAEAVALCREHDIVLVSDLAYSELTYDGFVAPSALQVPGARDVVVELHSCSKSFNMAGYRIGFAAGAPELLDALYAVRMNMGYGTPTVAQAAAAHALRHHRALTPPLAAQYRARRDAAVAGFRSLGWQPATPAGSMFLWLPIPAGFTTTGWTEHLVDTAGVVVTPGTAFGPGGEGWFRVSLAADVAVLDAAVERLRARGIGFD